MVGIAAMTVLVALVADVNHPESAVLPAPARESFPTAVRETWWHKMPYLGTALVISALLSAPREISYEWF